MKLLRFGLTVILILALGSATTAYAQASSHLVPVSELHSALAAKSAERDAHIAEIQTLLRHEAVREKLDGLVDLGKVENFVANLDDETLRDLGSESRRINNDVAAAGAAKTWIIVAAVAGAAFFVFYVWVQCDVC